MQFNSKVLLFGEYTVVLGARALAVPYPTFNGCLKLEASTTNKLVQNSKWHIAHFYRYIKKLMTNNVCLSIFDLPKFRVAIEQGLYFDSTIPQGYGIGSSGALIAAVYHQYALNKIPNAPTPNIEELNVLKRQLAQLEGHFHGKSSGTDPIICYLNKPLLLQNNTIQVPKIQTPIQPKGAIFLIDSQQKRPDHPLVPVFLDKLKQPEFHNICVHQLGRSNEGCIEAILNGDFDRLIGHAKIVSEIQLKYFTPMIPKHFSAKWKYGWQHNLFYAKVCGSGGGGFMLGVAELSKMADVQQYWGENNIKVVTYV